MERYTKWRDAGTGVAPFLPIPPPEFTTATVVLRVITFIVKIPLLVLAVLLFLLVDGFFRFSLGSVSKPAFEFSRSWAARLLLFACGFYRLPVSHDNRKVVHPGNGDVLVANSSSPIDILVLTYLYPSSLFTRCDNEALLETESALSAFGSRFRLDRCRKGSPLANLITKDRLIVVFPEGTTSNNRGLLAFCPIMLVDAYVTCIKYNSPAYLSTPVPGGYWMFLWSLASVWSHGCRVKCSSQKVSSEHSDALARLGRIPKTNLGIEEKESFLLAWRRR